MAVIKIESVIQLLSNTVQNGDEKTGASQLLARENVHPPQTENREEMPYISGNSIRGQLRRLIMADFFEQIDYKFKTMDAWHSFTGGGQLVQVNGEGMAHLELRRNIDAFLPPAKLWGFSYGDQPIWSTLTISNAILCCKENKFRIPEKYHQYCNQEYSYFIGHVFFTRKDDTKQHDALRSSNDAVIQMKVDMEVLNPGTQLYHKFAIKDATDVDKGCLARALNLWAELPHLGGKSSTGFGECDFNYTPVLDEKPYLDFIKQNKVQIQEILTKIESMFTPKVKKKSTKKVVQEKQNTLTLDETIDEGVNNESDSNDTTNDSE
jgi:hypothetical protein